MRDLEAPHQATDATGDVPAVTFRATEEDASAKRVATRGGIHDFFCNDRGDLDDLASLADLGALLSFGDDDRLTTGGEL